MRAPRETGMALVEALLFGIVLIVPLVWFLSMLSHVHRAAFATSAAAAEAGLVAVRAADHAAAFRLAQSAVTLALADAGLDMDRARLAVTFPERSPRGRPLHVEVSYPIRMIELPLLRALALPSIWVEAEHDVVVDPYSSRP